jgi:endoribonuclease Dicer
LKRINDLHAVELKVHTVVAMVCFVLTTHLLFFKLGYSFGNKSLLVQALLHASAMENYHFPSYQRLEFLGDAVLDFLVTRFVLQRLSLSQSKQFAWLQILV